jgi:hypothetical protein
MTLRATLAVTLSGILAAACAGDQDDDDSTCSGSKCDSLDDSEVPASPCDGVLLDRSGRKNSDGSPIERVAGRLGDPLATMVYRTEGGCPTSFADIMQKLQQEDAADCVDDGFTATAGLNTRVVTEQAQLRDSKQGAGYRTVTTRQCGNREAFGLIFSSFGVNPDRTDMPDGVEIMAFDQTDGVFNYYKEMNGKMMFFGNSVDYVTKGAEGPNLTDVRGCANCHTGGGMVMKELVSPWMHWEGDFFTPGAAELVSNRSDLLGMQGNGIEMESLTIAGNEAWNQTRIELMRSQGTVQDLLRPLFCPVEVNVANGSSSFVASGMLADPTLGFLSLFLENFEAAEAGYQALLEAINQRVPGHPGKRDTVAPLSHIERAGADQAYVRSLIELGIVNRQFVKDVLMVDFTRPVFSDDRCDLLSFAPSLSPSERTADSIRQGFIASLEAGSPGPAGQQLLQYLRAADQGTPAQHAFMLKDYEKVCSARLQQMTTIGSTPVSALMVDLIKLRSLGRKLAFPHDGVLDDASGSAERPLKVFEFEDTMATDDIQPTTSAQPSALLEVHPKARLSPSTCELVSSFEPVPIKEIETFGACQSQFGERGMCIDTDQVECPTFTQSGLCPGAAAIQCCFHDGGDEGG